MQSSKKYSVIAFDLHNVLFAPHYQQILRLLFSTPNKFQIMKTVLHPRFLFDALHLYCSTRVTEEYIITLGKKYTALEKHIDRAIEITNALSPITGTINLLHELKNLGYSLYIFSNIGQQTYEEFVKKYEELFTVFDGIHVTHAQNNWIQKPQPAAYVTFLQRFNVDPNSMIFIDDKKNNTNAAQSCGITAICYKSTTQLRKKLITLGVLNDC